MSQQYSNSGGTGGTNKADMWVMAHTSYFKPEHIIYLQDQLKHMPPERVDMLLTVNLKNPTTILILSIFLGELGVDRFMLGDTGMGVGKLLTLGGCLVWWFVDLFFVTNRAKQKNFDAVMLALGLRPYA